MSIGFPDGQRITQWLGAPLIAVTGLAVGAALHTDGPFSLASWASLIVAVKPSNGNLTVTVRQQINGGPPSLVERGQFVVPDGETLFESLVLFGDAVSVDLQGSNGAVVVDYAVYPSNTTINAQVLAAATLNFQHNDALTSSEPTLDFEDAGVLATLVDDAPNTRLKVSFALPAGVVLPFAGAAAPAGYLLCDGSVVSRNTYAALFAAIGVAYGAGDGATTFNLPDLRGRGPVGLGTNAAVNALGKNDGVAVANRRPQHRHTPHTHQVARDKGAPLAVAAGSALDTFIEANSTATDGGSGVAADSLDSPAFVVVNYIIAV